MLRKGPNGNGSVKRPQPNAERPNPNANPRAALIKIARGKKASPTHVPPPAISFASPIPRPVFPRKCLKIASRPVNKRKPIAPAKIPSMMPPVRRLCQINPSTKMAKVNTFLSRNCSTSSYDAAKSNVVSIARKKTASNWAKLLICLLLHHCLT